MEIRLVVEMTGSAGNVGVGGGGSTPPQGPVAQAPYTGTASGNQRPGGGGGGGRQRGGGDEDGPLGGRIHDEVAEEWYKRGGDKNARAADSAYRQATREQGHFARQQRAEARQAESEARRERAEARHTEVASRSPLAEAIGRQTGRFVFGQLGSTFFGRYGGYAASGIGAFVGERAARFGGGYATALTAAGIAQPVLGAVGSLVNHAVNRAEELAPYSGASAASDIRVQMMELRANMRSAREYGRDLGDIREAATALKLVGVRFMDGAASIFGPLARAINKYLGGDTARRGDEAEKLMQAIQAIRIPGIDFDPDEGPGRANERFQQWRPDRDAFGRPITFVE